MLVANALIPLSTAEAKQQTKLTADLTNSSTVETIQQLNALKAAKEAWYVFNIFMQHPGVVNNYNQGIANYELRNYPVAIKYYDKVLAEAPNYTGALNNKGLALSALGNYTGAIRYYDKALALIPNDVEGLNNKGLALYGLGNYAGAIRYYDMALAIDPSYVNSFNNKANALVKLGRYDEADANYKKAIMLETGSKKGGFITQSYNESEHYIRIFRVDVIVNQDPSIKVIITNQGILDKLRKNYDLAIVRFNFVLTHLDPNYYYALWNEADAYRLSGQNAEANIYFNKAIMINPTSNYNGETIGTPAIDRGQGCSPNGLFKTLAATC